MASRSIPANGGVGEVVEQLSQMLDAGRKDDALAAVRMMLEAVVRENEQQRQKIAELLRRVYGSSGEKLDPRQLRLALEEMRSEAQAQQPAVDPEETLPNEPPKPPREPNAKERHGRRKLPADLPREEIRLFPIAEQVADKGTMSKVDEERSEVLEYQPATFKVLVYIREIWSNAEGQIVTAPVPNKVIAKGLPGPGLLTQITLSKYEDHCPLNRQTRMYARSGVELHRNTLVDWLGPWDGGGAGGLVNHAPLVTSTLSVRRRYMSQDPRGSGARLGPAVGGGRRQLPSRLTCSSCSVCARRHGIRHMPQNDQAVLKGTL